MPLKKPPTIAPAPPERLTQNFAKLLQFGLDEVQRLSHDIWTDYNEHDPGVTMLEALCYGLTDAAYRTDHPIEDILSSSALATGVRADQQPLFTGDHILTNAPQTENDFRKLAYDAITDLRNLWMQPATAPQVGPHGLYDVYIQAYSSSPDNSLADPQPVGGTDRLLREVKALLNKSRNLGQDFARIAMIDSQEIALDVTLTIAPDQRVETVLAQMLYRIEAQMNPAPMLRDVGLDLGAGIPPTEIFQGPRLSHGWIRDDSLAPLKVNLNQEAVLYVINGTPGVGDVGPLTMRRVGKAGPDHAQGTPQLFVLSRDTTDLERIRVFRNGNELRPDLRQVRASWHHLEEQARWNAGYATRNVDQLAYASVPQGNAHRGLGRYRSIQHLFPGAYGLGAQGAPMGVVPSYQRELGAQASRNGARRQLKAYLLFFEQLLTNHLGQLENASLLLSFAPQEVTYHPQPLLDPKRPNPDAPPDIAPVLGEGAMPPDAKKDWYSRYCDGIKALSMAQDPVEARIGRTLDAFLARFNDAFPDATLRRTRHLGTDPDEPFERWLNTQKRGYLYRLVPITSRRGLGLNLADPREPVPVANTAPDSAATAPPGAGTPPAPARLRPQRIALEEAVRAKTGHEGTLAVIEHLLLRDFSLRNAIPNLEINNTFLIQPRDPVFAVRLGEAQRPLHLLLDTGVPGADWPGLAQRIAALGADPARYTTSPPGSYQVQIQLRDDTGLRLHVLEECAAHFDAKRIIRRMAALCQSIVNGRTCLNEALCPATVPLDFFASRTSVFLTDLSPLDTTRENRSLVESLVARQMPAHLAHRCYWLRPQDIPRFNALQANWMAALTPLYQTPDPSEACKIRATEATRPLRALVQEYYVRAICALRDSTRPEPRSIAEGIAAPVASGS